MEFKEPKQVSRDHQMPGLFGLQAGLLFEPKPALEFKEPKQVSRDHKMPELFGLQAGLLFEVLFGAQAGHGVQRA